MTNHVLPPLPYSQDALEPHISAKTLSFHYGKHHQAYVTNLNNLLQNHDLATISLEDLIHQSAGKPETAGIFNNAAQIWNHTFYWHCMKPQGGGKPTGLLLEKIIATFGTFEHFVAEFRQAALTQFGSGWAWLVQKEDRSIAITKTSNADTPMAHGQTALLTCDIWEHAYYIDYQNRRPDYVDTFMAHLVNWEFVSSNMKQ